MQIMFCRSFPAEEPPLLLSSCPCICFHGATPGLPLDRRRHLVLSWLTVKVYEMLFRIDLPAIFHTVSMLCTNSSFETMYSTIPFSNFQEPPSFQKARLIPLSVKICFNDCPRGLRFEWDFDFDWHSLSDFIECCADNQKPKIGLWIIFRGTQKVPQ